MCVIYYHTLEFPSYTQIVFLKWNYSKNICRSLPNQLRTHINFGLPWYSTEFDNALDRNRLQRVKLFYAYTIV